jgi:hypothetical protein
LVFQDETLFWDYKRPIRWEEVAAEPEGVPEAIRIVFGLENSRLDIRP